VRAESYLLGSDCECTAKVILDGACRDIQAIFWHADSKRKTWCKPVTALVESKGKFSLGSSHLRRPQRGIEASIWSLNHKEPQKSRVSVHQAAVVGDSLRSPGRGGQGSVETRWRTETENGDGCVGVSWPCLHIPRQCFDLSDCLIVP
jgi:hypothetical protein